MSMLMVIMVGVPASGKSTWGKKYANDNKLVYISTDEIKGEVGKGEEDQSVAPASWMIAKKRVIEALSLGKSVVIDATNINHKVRKQWVKIGREYKADIIAVAFEVDRETLIRRDNERSRHVGEEVIDQYLKMYKRPDTNEVDKVIINP